MENKNCKIDVSIIIVSWNTCDILSNCLNSIYQETADIVFEIIVIDNGSVDGTPAMISNDFPDVTFIKNRNNRGFAAANNQGLKISKGRYLLLLNPDTIILEKAIDKMVCFADHRKEYSVFGCKVYEEQDVVQMTCFSFPSVLISIFNLTGLHRKLPRSKVFGKEKMLWWQRNSEREVDVVSGMFMLIRREAIRDVGFMDEDYFVYAEEADWCFRFWQRGWKCFFTPVAKILHLDGGGKSTGQQSVKMYVQLQKSILIFHRKNLGKASWLATKSIYIAGMFVRLILFQFLSLIRIGERPRHKKQQAYAALKFHLLGVEPDHG